MYECNLKHAGNLAIFIAFCFNKLGALSHCKCLTKSLTQINWKKLRSCISTPQGGINNTKITAKSLKSSGLYGEVGSCWAF